MKINWSIIFSLCFFLFIQCKKTNKESIELPPVANQNYGTLFKVVHEQSIIYWIGSSTISNHNGTLKLKGGKMEIDSYGQMKSGNFTIDMNSLENLDITNSSDKKDLENHLKSGEFFATDTFPEAEFYVTKVSPIGDSLTNNIIEGNLTLRGIELPIEMRAKIIVSGNTAIITVPEYILDRTKWGINYHSSKIKDMLKDKLISDDIKISMKILAVKM